MKGRKNFLGHHGWTRACGWPDTEAESGMTDLSYILLCAHAQPICWKYCLHYLSI